MPEQFANSLIHEKSPYLLQHAYNPVKWETWNETTLQRARTENKLLLISIGYSACHWCHVMESESFEDAEVAQLMNENFICIKIDREERPDVDQVYMTAVQLMTGHGGWPLNCFTLPDGRPIYGGTYFPKQQWMSVLQSVAEIWKNNPSKAEEYAAELTNGMLHLENREPAGFDINYSLDILHQSVKRVMDSFDYEWGGYNRAPKFPLPNNWIFFLRYAHVSGNEVVLKQVNLTLSSMAGGGIYDHIVGGFARYSTDLQWKIPHFEKMLYDNAQLISLYAEAFSKTRNENYLHSARETAEFLANEMRSPEGGFYSALDADTDGEEGRYYVWEEEELRTLMPQTDFELFAKVFSVNEEGYWEGGKYILLRNASLAQLAVEYSVRESELREKISNWKKTLSQYRSSRTRPGLDDKILFGWNGMAVRAFCDLFRITNEDHYLQSAINTMEFIFTHGLKEDGSLFHAYKNGAYIHAFLEDYAFVIDAAIALYSLTANNKWINMAVDCTEYCFRAFYDFRYGLFYFTSVDADPLVVRKTETTDNVIPSANSQMARNLIQLYKITGKNQYKQTAERMLCATSHEIVPYLSGHSNWALAMMELLGDQKEVVIIGTDCKSLQQEIASHYLPDVAFYFSEEENDTFIFKGRYKQGKTLIYVCKNQTCLTPVETFTEALQLMN